ncbi:MAG: hypothetical protein FJ000_10475, partial [Actinobacteria bacterium]|nr:hypothetical protein [Actinomycetota bacterium]
MQHRSRRHALSSSRLALSSRRHTLSHSLPRLLAAIVVVALLAGTALACGGSADTSPDTGGQQASPSPLITDEGSASPAPTDGPTPGPTDGATPSPTDTASPTVTASPSPTGGSSAEQNTLAAYFASVGPVYSSFMSQWWQAYHISSVRAHKTMDQTWPIAARLLRKPLARLEVVEDRYQTVVPVPATLIKAHTQLGNCIASVDEYYTMA